VARLANRHQIVSVKKLRVIERPLLMMHFGRRGGPLFGSTIQAERLIR
jgi:hypothetical protein